MPITRSGQFTYQKQTSSWDIMQAQRTRLRAKIQQYQSDLSTAANAFANQSNAIGDTANRLVMQRAIDRVLEEAAAKKAQAARLL